MSDLLSHFREVWLVDFEFGAGPGERPEPRCMVAVEFRTGTKLRFWADQLSCMSHAPFSTGRDAMLVAYYASAELGCFLALNWPMPARVLDLFTEFRTATNGRPVPCGYSLLGASAHFGIDGIDSNEKDEMRKLALRGGQYTEPERLSLLEYCQSDVVALSKLLPAMLPTLDLARALLRGRYMAAVARMEWEGVPIDVEQFQILQENWQAIRSRLTAEVDSEFGVYAPANRRPGESLIEGPSSFSARRFEQWLEKQNIHWPRIPSGSLALDDDTFRQMSRSYPAVAPLRELRHTLSGLRLFDLAVGADGRNRCLLSPFRSITGRNQPSNARFIFGPSCWLRGLIRPAPDRAVAYVDWSQQEFGIAAALSGDPAMIQAYASGDPYLTFAKQAGAVPAGATKKSHCQERERFKVCALAVQYGMESKSLAEAINQPEAYARKLLRLHRETYPRYWDWSQAAVSHAMLVGWLQTVFGWRFHVGAKANHRSLANFPMQANGAEMLRLACCLATERGIAVCAPVHDALLVEGPADTIEAVVRATQSAMVEASRVVLSGFELRSDTKIVRYPDRYMDPRGERLWGIVGRILADLRAQRTGTVSAD